MKKTALLASAAILALGAQGALANTIGAVSALNKDVDGTPPAAETRQLVLGDGVVLNERIESSPVGSGQFLFLDQTSLTIAKQSVLVLDKYVYDPATKTGEFAMSMSRGVLRFVGGRITKQTDAVITTPTATIGIRGGMAIVIIDQDGTTRVMHIAGDYTRVTTLDGEEIVVTRSNGVVEVTNAAITYLGVADARLVEETSQALIGRGDAGERIEPEDPDVVESGLPDANSGRKGASEESPISTRGEASPDRTGEDEEPSGFTRSEEEITTIIVDGGLPPVINPPEPPAPPPPPVNPLTFLPGVTGAASFSGSTIPGVVGGGGQNFIFTQVFEGSRVGITANNEVFSIPVANGFFDFTAQQGASPLGGIAGSGFFNPNAEFTYAVFQTASGRTGAFLTGTPSAALPSAASGMTTIRSYTLSNDLFTKNGAPFVPGTVTGFSADGRSALTLLSNTGGAATGGNARAVATYLDINGNGVNQTSGFGVLTANVVASDKGTPAFSDFFEGSFNSGTAGATRIETNVATAEDGQGSSAFGAGAQHFALTNSRNLGASAAPGRAISATGTETFFGSNNVANRSSVANVETGGSRVFDGGFAAIGGQDLETGQRYVGRTVFREDGFTGFVDPALNQASAQIRLDEFFTGDFDNETIDVQDVRFNFGGGDGRSAAINGDEFAMRDSFDTGETSNNVNGVEGLPSDGIRDGQGSLRGALASADLAGNAQSIFPAGITPTSSVLSWGWWSAEFRHDPDQIGNPNNEGQELSSDQRYHLGAWVAGDLTANLPQVGIATYEGFAVVSAVQNGRSFVDGAGFALNFNFGDRSGNANFTDILGADANVAVRQNEGGAVYGGTADITIAGDEGIISVDGSFFNDLSGAPARGTAGSLGFATNNGNTFGTGVFAGDRTSFSQGETEIPITGEFGQ